MLDPPERVNVGLEQVPGTPDRVVLREGMELVFGLGEDLFHQGVEPFIELGPAAASVGEDEPPLLDEVSEVLLALGGELGGRVAVEEEDRGLHQVANRRHVGVHDLPRDKVLPVPRDQVHEIPDIVGVVIPVSRGPVTELVDQDWRSPLGEKKEGETGRDIRAPLEPFALPEAGELVLIDDELRGPFAIPILLAEVTLAGKSAGPFEPVKVIVAPGLTHVEVLPHVEVPRQPVDPAEEFGIEPPLAAVLDPGAFEGFLSLEPFQARDDQAGDPGSGHAGGGNALVGGIRPAAVTPLIDFPVSPRQGPDLGADRDAHLGGGVEREQGILGVRAVAPFVLELGVSPRTRPVHAVAGLDLGAFEPGDIGGNPKLVALGVGRREDHGLERDRVGALEVFRAVIAEVVECLDDRRRIDRLAGGQEGQRDKARDAGLRLLARAFAP